MQLSRRRFTLGALAMGALGSFSGTAHAAAGHDYTSRETFDLFDKVFHESGNSGRPTDTNEHGGLAWGQSYVLAGFIRMYEAYKDTRYLDSAGQYLQAPRWMAVAQWDDTVFSHSRSIHDARTVEPQLGSYLGCVAYLNWHARRGA